MTIYRYVALDAQGQEQSGSIEAPDPAAVAGLLRQRALYVVSLVDPDAKQPSSGGIALGRSLRAALPVRSQDRIFFFQQLGLMLRSGLTVLQALDVCGNLSRSPRMSAAIERMCGRIRGGAGLSRAMEEEGGLFPVLAIRLVQSAEVSGELDLVLDRIAEHLEQKATLRRNLITSLIYPAIVLLSSVGVAIFLVATVIPRFAEFFARSNRSLPPMTQNLIDVSNFVLSVGPYLLLGLALLVVAGITAYATERGRLAIDRGVLFVPVVGAVITKAAMAQTSWALAMLLRSGVTLLESLRVGAGIIGNKAIRGAMEGAAEQILNGRDLARALQQDVIPELVARLSAVGERTGSLDHVMQELGGHYDRELQASIKRMTATVEPLLILLIGGMVGFVYYAFFQAVFSMAG